MIRIADVSHECSPAIDKHEPHAEWLGGEAWVNPVHAYHGACGSTPDPRGEPAALDWIPL